MGTILLVIVGGIVLVWLFTSIQEWTEHAKAQKNPIKTLQEKAKHKTELAIQLGGEMKNPKRLMKHQV